MWGADITPDDTPYEAGLGFAVKLDKEDFIGREALLEAQEPERRLACLVLSDPRSVALGSEPVRVDGELVGRVTSGGYGYTVERSIAYAYVPARARASPGSRSRWRSSASGSRARSPPSRSSILPESGSGAEPSLRAYAVSAGGGERPRLLAFEPLRAPRRRPCAPVP